MTLLPSNQNADQRSDRYELASVDIRMSQKCARDEEDEVSASDTRDEPGMGRG